MPDAFPRPYGLALVIAVYLGLGALWAVLIPPFEKPDEIAHFSYVQFVAQYWKIPRQKQESFPFLEPETQQPPFYYVLAAAVYKSAATAGLPQTDLKSWENRLNPNFAGRIPNGQQNFFEHREHLFEPNGGFSYDVILVRLFSLALGAVTLVLIYNTARVIFHGHAWLPMTTTALVATLPQFTFISTSVSNDVMAFALGALILYRLVKLQAEGLTRSYLSLGLLMGLAVLIKFTLLALLPLVLLAVPKAAMRKQAKALGLFALGFIAVGGWWFLRNTVLYGDVLGRQEIINPAAYAWNIDRKALLSPYFRDVFWWMLGQSVVGKFGFMRIDMPPFYYRIWLTLLVVSTIGLVIRFAQSALIPSRYLRAHEGEHDSEQGLRPWLLFGGAVLLALAALIHYNLMVSQPQGRYLFHVLPAIACLFVAGLVAPARLVGSALRFQRTASSATGLPSMIALSIIAVLAGVNLYALFFVVLPCY